ncbi:hypothetical protein M231_06708 [Tremella mesenterica]|uniref:Uncharacterized protein n=1 Tax=Tremella mesenterica TaxID=5217 RepID=A0A4Q1BDL5_TREME|nr:uncharacterized protein TREMEDRAFT_60842 [Tremella mesenterica DSM 1558]EIW70353.1 hypothetical protein TREMEDRAFT_60842 [Tremella mesenterica DSM 1558]RXK35994.1 hypothetical protein M231_06708 [Tremella mesenterica]
MDWLNQTHFWPASDDENNEDPNTDSESGTLYDGMDAVSDAGTERTMVEFSEAFDTEKVVNKWDVDFVPDFARDLGQGVDSPDDKLHIVVHSSLSMEWDYQQSKLLVKQTFRNHVYRPVYGAYSTDRPYPNGMLDMLLERLTSPGYRRSMLDTVATAQQVQILATLNDMDAFQVRQLLQSEALQQNTVLNGSALSDAMSKCVQSELPMYQNMQTVVHKYNLTEWTNYMRIARTENFKWSTPITSLWDLTAATPVGVQTPLSVSSGPHV